MHLIQRESDLHFWKYEVFKKRKRSDSLQKPKFSKNYFYWIFNIFTLIKNLQFIYGN